MKLSAIGALSITVFTQIVPTFANKQIQPGLYVAPQFPANLSKDPSDWTHSTPLLQLFGSRHSRSDISTTTGLQARQNINNWRGWDNVKYIFALYASASTSSPETNSSSGDSYTSTGFDVSGTQPSAANPLGNPPYPGATSSNGPNYVDFLTTTYNQSFIQTYNFGFGGALIDNAIVQSPFGAPPSLNEQVKADFEPGYRSNILVPWTPGNTLFTIMFGINDAINTYSRSDNDSLQYAQIKSYENIMEKLYMDGARNFLILNVPPIDRSPMASVAGQLLIGELANWIGRFLFRLDQLVLSFARRYPDVTAFHFNTNYLFTLVLNNPAQFAETAGFRNTTQFCSAYQYGTLGMDDFNPSCGIPVNEFFWLNDLHPTYPMHNFLASQVSKLLVSR